MNVLDSIFVSTTDSSLTSFSNAIDSLESQLSSLQTKTDILTGIIETSNDSIANQLSATNIVLAAVAIVIAIVGGLLGLYIKRKKAEIESLATTIEGKRKTIESAAEATAKLDEQIKGNLGELYKQLRNEETKALIDRLVLEPRDVGNLIHPLLARDLEEDKFGSLKEAYLKLKSETKTDEKPEDVIGFVRLGGTSPEEDYILLFFQHFCCQSVSDDQIRPELIKGFKDTCQKAFKRDIIKSTIDLCKALSDEKNSFNKEDVLVEYLKALNLCEHKKLVDLKNIFEQNLTPATLLEKAKERCKTDGVYLALFGMVKPEEAKDTDATQ